MIPHAIGIIGLGKMGSNISERIIESGHRVYGYDIDGKKISALQAGGGYACSSLQDLVKKLGNPRIILLSVPAGDTVDLILHNISPELEKGDIIIDSGNSFYQDSQKRAAALSLRGIYFIDVGISGGIAGARKGACLMIGGDETAVADVDFLFSILSRTGSYRYFGRAGSGHLVKGIHNLVEYGYLQSLAEGLESIREIMKNEEMTPVNLEQVCDTWSRGSILESRVVHDAKKAFGKYNTLDSIEGSVHGQTIREMQSLVTIAEKYGVKIYSCRAAINARLDSQKNPTYSGKIINAIRNIFGGHTDWKK